MKTKNPIKKQELFALLWETPKSTYSGHIGRAFVFNDFEALIRHIVMGHSWYSLSNKDIRDFKESCEKGQVMIASIGKNVNGAKQTSRFVDILDGEYFVNSIVRKNTDMHYMYKMDSAVRNTLGTYGMHCKFVRPRPLTLDEFSIVSKVISESVSYDHSDEVFNLFAWLCSMDKKSPWKASPDSGGADKRIRNYIEFTTKEIFDKRITDTVIEASTYYAKIAHKLTLQLTGCDIALQNNSGVDFVEGIVNSRYCVNDNTCVNEVCKPSIKINDLFELFDGDRTIIGDSITRNDVSLIFDSVMPLNAYKYIEKYIDKSKVTVLEMNTMSEYRGITPDDFKGIKHCKIFYTKPTFGDGFNLAVCLYGDTATTYEMLGDVRTFLSVINNN